MISLQAIETEAEDPTLHEMEVTRNTTIQRLWDLTDTYNTLNKKAWDQSINAALSEHQSSVVQLVRRGFDGRTNTERWTFPSALMFTLRQPVLPAKESHHISGRPHFFKTSKLGFFMAAITSSHHQVTRYVVSEWQ